MVCVSFATVQFSPSCSPQFLSPWFLEASLIKLIGPPFGKFGPHFSAALLGPALSLSGNPVFFWHCSLGSPVSLGCSPSPPEAGVSWPGCPVSLGVLLVQPWPFCGLRGASGWRLVTGSHRLRVSLLTLIVWLNPDFWFYLKITQLFFFRRLPYKNHHHVISLRSFTTENNSQHNLIACGKRYLENHNYDLISDLFWKTLIVISLKNTEEFAFRASHLNEHKFNHCSRPRK